MPSGRGRMSTPVSTVFVRGPEKFSWGGFKFCPEIVYDSPMVACHQVPSAFDRGLPETLLPC